MENNKGCNLYRTGTGRKSLQEKCITQRIQTASGTGKAKIDLSACSIQLSEQTYVYDGTEKTPTVTITYNEKTLTEGKDYQVYFADNVNPGTAKITVIAKTDSDYTGTATITFEIRKSLPENATVIEPGAFSNCTNLVDLNIKENVTEIGDNAFADSKICRISISTATARNSEIISSKM